MNSPSRASACSTRSPGPAGEGGPLLRLLPGAFDRACGGAARRAPGGPAHRGGPVPRPHAEPPARPACNPRRHPGVPRASPVRPNAGRGGLRGRHHPRRDRGRGRARSESGLASPRGPGTSRTGRSAIAGPSGGSLAHADPAADWPVVLAALGAEVWIEGPAGARAEPLHSFIRGPFATSLGEGEILTAVRVPSPSPSARFGYSKLAAKSGEFAQALAVVFENPERDERRAVVGAIRAATARHRERDALLTRAVEFARPPCRAAPGRRGRPGPRGRSRPRGTRRPCRPPGPIFREDLPAPGARRAFPPPPRARPDPSAIRRPRGIGAGSAIAVAEPAAIRVDPDPDPPCRQRPAVRSRSRAPHPTSPTSFASAST